MALRLNTVILFSWPLQIGLKDHTCGHRDVYVCLTDHGDLDETAHTEICDKLGTFHAWAPAKESGPFASHFLLYKVPVIRQFAIIGVRVKRAFRANYPSAWCHAICKRAHVEIRDAISPTFLYNYLLLYQF